MTRRGLAARAMVIWTGGPRRCSAQRRSTCSGRNRENCRLSSMTSWPARPTTGQGRVSRLRWPAAGRTPVRLSGPASSRTRRWNARGSPELVADCLDAALAAHWGPDELDVRRSLVTRLDEVAAHVIDPDVRLQAHLWGLQVACEALDLQAIHRQMRALELLGEESARALFFAASRRLMLDLLRGRTDTAARLTAMAATAAERASLADAWMVLKAMPAYAAAQSRSEEHTSELQSPVHLV